MNELALFAGAGGGILGGGCSDGEQSVPLNGNRTQLAYLPPDRMTAFSRVSRFGMTFKPLTESRGEELLTLFREASLAKTYPQQEREQESPESAAECGRKWRGSLAKFDPVLLSWKTVQLSALGDSELSLVIWPRSGMTANGQCWELPTLERIIKGTGFGWWPTPTVNDSKNSTLPESQRERDGLAGSLMRSGEQTGGQLNPIFVEWLMGWPLGWTDLKPLAMDKFQSWQQQHSVYY